MLRAKVSADTSTTNVMIKPLCVRNWEECLSIPKREMEIQSKKWRRAGAEGQRGSRPAATWAKWSLKKLLVVSWVKGLLRTEP